MPDQVAIDKTEIYLHSDSWIKIYLTIVPADGLSVPLEIVAWRTGVLDTCPHTPGVGPPIQSIICHNSIVDRHVSTRVLCNDDPQCVGVPPLSGAVVGPTLLTCRPVE